MQATTKQSDIAIREAEAIDLRALVRLSELDSRRVPAGRVLVARADGELRAALSIDSGELVADPFVATAELEALLRMRADQLRRESAGVRRRRRRGLLRGLHVRPGRAV